MLHIVVSEIAVIKLLHTHSPPINMNPIGEGCTYISADHDGGLPGVAIFSTPCLNSSILLKTL